MSLTSFMRNGFSNEVCYAIPPPKIQEYPMIAGPTTNNYMLIGTAFDYLLRTELKRNYPDVIESKPVGDAAINLITQDFVICNATKEEKMFLLGGKTRTTDNQKAMIRRMGDEFHSHRLLFLKTGNLTDEFIKSVLSYAKLDLVVRRGYFNLEEILREPNPLDIDDMRHLYNAIPKEIFEFKPPIFLDPILAGGADVDLVLGDSLLDIKTTKFMKNDRNNWAQIVGYLCLAERVKEIPEIRKMGFYFSRQGKIWAIDTDYVTANKNYEKIRDIILNRFKG